MLRGAPLERRHHISICWCVLNDKASPIGIKIDSIDEWKMAEMRRTLITELWWPRLIVSTYSPMAINLWKSISDILLTFNFEKFPKAIKIISSKIITSDSIQSHSTCLKYGRHLERYDWRNGETEHHWFRSHCHIQTRTKTKRPFYGSATDDSLRHHFPDRKYR